MADGDRTMPDNNGNRKHPLRIILDILKAILDFLLAIPALVISVAVLILVVWFLIKFTAITFRF
jgi:lipopolysaccharide/colanic/teichoic acid biosynthesis glycosyltransferase